MKPRSVFDEGTEDERPTEVMNRRWSVSSSALVLVIVSLTGCSSGAETVDCATATVKPFSELQSELAHCTNCHGANRADAGYRYDNYDDASRAASAAADEIGSGSMPPDEDLTDDEVTAITAWALCGTPE